MKTLKETNIVIVDAEPVTRLGLFHLINKEPSLRVCGETHCLNVARDLCANHKPRIVIFDPLLGDGLAFIKDLPQWSPETRAVIYTAEVDVLLMQRAFKAGAFGYVYRRDPVNSLLTAIRGALDGHRHVSPQMENVMLGNLANGALEMRADGMPSISNRESETLRWLGKGKTNRQIAEEMKVSIKTIETHCQRLKEKLNLHGSAALRQYAALHKGSGESH